MTQKVGIPIDIGRKYLYNALTPQFVKKILKHLDLWDVKRKPPPCANPPEADLKPLLAMINPQRLARKIT